MTADHLTARFDNQPPAAIGDWLLTFGPSVSGLPVRTSAAQWRTERQTENWRLSLTTPSASWRGAPILPIETEEWSVWLTGELYGVTDWSRLVIDLLEGRIAAGQLNGHFLLIANHHSTGEWHIWTARHATLHAYMATNGIRTAIGTYLPSVAAATGRASLDWEGLTSFFGFGFFAADRTHFSDVLILRPAMHYRLDSHGRVTADERYWHWRHAPDTSRSYDETLDEFAALFASVMGELTAAGRIAVPISGGLDSRSTIATLVAGRADVDRFWTFSYGYASDSIEPRIAGQIAAARSLPFTPFVIQPYLFERIDDVISAVEGFQDVTLARQAAITGDIQRHADVMIAAHWGDVFLDDMGLVSLPPGSLTHEQLVDRALVKFTKSGGWLLDALCRPQLDSTTTQDVLRGFIDSEMAKLTGIDEPDFYIKAFKTEQWSARWTTASVRMFQAGAFPRLPFYDTRISDFFTTVPTAYVAGRRMQLDYLKRYAPDLATVTWQETGSNLFKVGRRDPAALMRRAINKGRRKLSRRQVIERNWEVQFLSPAGRRNLEQWLLRPGLPVHEFVSPRQIAELVDTFFASPWTEKRSYSVSMLLTFSAWLERQIRESGSGQ